MSAVRLHVEATLEDGTVKRYTGRQAWTLQQLVSSGATGVTPIERPAPRWSDYVLHLRRSGLTIETIPEKHSGLFSGTHGRYVLHDKVKLATVNPEKQKPAGSNLRALNPKSQQASSEGKDE